MIDVTYNQQMQQQIQQQQLQMQKQQQLQFEQMQKQRREIADRWNKTMLQLQKAKQAEFNARMRWTADPKQAGQFVDGMTDWLSDDIRQQTVQRQSRNWNHKEHINPDSNDYKFGFYMGMMLGNSEARKEIMGIALKPLNERLKHNKVVNLQQQAEQIKQQEMPGLKVDAESAGFDAPDPKEAQAYANASRKAMLHGHSALTPETAALEKIMVDQAAISKMHENPKQVKDILASQAMMHAVIDKKAKTEHVPANLINQKQNELFSQMAKQDPQLQYMYQETSEGFSVKNGKLYDNKGQEIDKLNMRQPFSATQYADKGLVAFEEATKKAYDKDGQVVVGKKRDQIKNDYQDHLENLSQMAQFDGHKLSKNDLSKMVQRSALDASTLAMNNYMAKRFGYKTGLKMSLMSLAFNAKTIGYSQKDLKNAAKEFARGNRLRSVKINDQIDNLIHEHDVVQNIAGLSNISLKDFQDNYENNGLEILQKIHPNSGNLQEISKKVNTQVLQYFDQAKLNDLVGKNNAADLNKAIDFVENPLDSPAKQMRDAVEQQPAVKQKQIEANLAAYEKLGHNQNYKQPKKSAKSAKKKTVSKTTRKKTVKKKQAEKPKPQKNTLSVLNDPVFGYSDEKKKPKEDLPSLEEMNPTLAKNTKKQNAAKDVDQMNK